MVELIDPGVIKFYDNSIRTANKQLKKAKESGKADAEKYWRKKLQDWRDFKKRFIKQGGFTKVEF